VKATAGDLRIVLSDLHLGTGHRKGIFNPYEDFYEDEKFAELLKFYSSQWGRKNKIELILAGDFLDLMKVPVGKDGKFSDEITEEIAEFKVNRCLTGHPKVCEALTSFLERSETTLTIVPGNHDIELLLPGVQKRVRDIIAPGTLGAKVQFIDKSPAYNLPEGIQIHHGHMLEPHLQFDYNRLMLPMRDGKAVLNLPWGSLLLLRVIIPAKRERYLVDHIYPLSRLILGGLLFDFRFTIRLSSKIMYQFFATRIASTGKMTLKKIWEGVKIIKEAIIPVRDFDQNVERLLRRTMGVHTIITGHSHRPRYKLVGDDKLYVNTGTWVKMLNIDLEHMGQDTGLTYATITYDEKGKPFTELYRWSGGYRITNPVHY